MGSFPGENVRSHKSWGSTGDNFRESALVNPPSGPAVAVAHRPLADAEQGRPAADHAASRLVALLVLWRCGVGGVRCGRRLRVGG